MATTNETFHISAEQAERYEADLVRAGQGLAARALLKAAGVAAGHRVLDVACGTGQVTRVVADAVGPRGSVVGVDLNENMLAVAQRLHPGILWQQADISHLPFPDEHFDVVLCEEGLSYFSDPAAALREMARVLRPAGRIGVQVAAELAVQPGYGPWIEMIAAEAGDTVADLPRCYFQYGDLEILLPFFTAANLRVEQARSWSGSWLFPSVEEMVRSEVEDTPLRDRISASQYERILTRSHDVLAPYVGERGVDIPWRWLVVTATKRGGEALG